MRNFELILTAALSPFVVRDLWSSGIVTCVEDYRSQVVRVLTRARLESVVSHL